MRARVNQEEVDELFAAHVLLCQILDEHKNMLKEYWERYPNLCAATGLIKP